MADIKLLWLSGKDASSRREAYLYWIGPEPYGVKWRNFKLALTRQNFRLIRSASCPFRIINLIANPKNANR